MTAVFGSHSLKERRFRLRLFGTVPPPPPPQTRAYIDNINLMRQPLVFALLVERKGKEIQCHISLGLVLQDFRRAFDLIMARNDGHH